MPVNKRYYNNLICCGNCQNASWDYYQNECKIDKDCMEHDHFCDQFIGENPSINYISPEELLIEKT